MRAAVVILNLLSALAVVAVEPIAFYVGAWGLLGPAYDDYGALALGLAIMAAPLVILAICVWLSMRRLRAGGRDAIVVASAPLAIACVAGLALAPMFSGR